MMPDIGASRHVLVQARAQVGFALRLEEIVERTHLGLVVGPAAISRRPECQRWQ